VKQQRVARSYRGSGWGKFDYGLDWEEQRMRQRALETNPPPGPRSHRTRSKYDALVAELLKRPFPTLWAADDFLREFALPAHAQHTFGQALRVAGLERMCIWLEYDPVTKKRNYIAIWRLLKTKLPEHLRHRRQWLREYRRQWNYVRGHRESIERLQQITRYLAEIVA
jgi:hypothetical protein